MLLRGAYMSDLRENRKTHILSLGEQISCRVPPFPLETCLH